MTMISQTSPLIVLSDKFKCFLNTLAEVEFLEGTTAAGKTTVGIPKFMTMVSLSSKKYHLLCAKTIGIAEKNLLNGDVGLLAQYRNTAVYNPSGAGKIRLPHVSFETSNGTKIIYLAGYGDKSKWQDVLGGQYGCVMIDEINIADIEFIREISHRRQYLLATLNPDDPSLPVYDEYINKSRPLKKYTKDYPEELLRELNKAREIGWIHWYFTFYDNASLTEEDIKIKIAAVPLGTKMYKNKIQGLRGRATGLVFPNFDKARHTISYADAKSRKYVMYSLAVDTSYSSESEDTVSFIFQGITDKHELVVLDEEVYNNKDQTVPLAPSDIVPRLFSFADRCAQEWGTFATIYIDSADAATITEAQKYLRAHPRVYSITPSWKKLPVVSRIHLQLGWLNTNEYLVVDHCVHHIRELEIYSWKEDKYEPEDKHDHTINASQYGWLPFKGRIGTGGGAIDS